MFKTEYAKRVYEALEKENKGEVEYLQAAREILESLTDWFEVEESWEKYIADSAGQPFWASADEDIIEGFLCLKETGKETMELAVMGVRKESHRKGTGRRLFEEAKDYAVRKGYDFHHPEKCPKKSLDLC